MPYAYGGPDPAIVDQSELKMTRKSKPKRACRLCKWHKYLGNGKEAKKPSVRRRLQPEE